MVYLYAHHVIQNLVSVPPSHTVVCALHDESLLALPASEPVLSPVCPAAVTAISPGLQVPRMHACNPSAKMHCLSTIAIITRVAFLSIWFSFLLLS